MKNNTIMFDFFKKMVIILIFSLILIDISANYKMKKQNETLNLSFQLGWYQGWDRSVENMENFVNDTNISIENQKTLFYKTDSIDFSKIIFRK